METFHVTFVHESTKIAFQDLELNLNRCIVV